jgi:hypothetical protein
MASAKPVIKVSMPPWSGLKHCVTIAIKIHESEPNDQISLAENGLGALVKASRFLRAGRLRRH